MSAAPGGALQADFIVVGAGAAGCVLANRLSADPRHRVLLIEAGGPAASLWFKLPVGYRYTIGNPRHDWCFDGEPEPGLGGRVIRHPRGKALGGSTAINGMVAIRGQAADYEGWRDLGWKVLAVSRAAFDAPFDDHPGLTMIFYDLRPSSRGHLRLRSADAGEPPRILMNYLATARDRQVAADGLRLTRRIMAAPALAGQQPVELSPGAAVRDDDEAALHGAIAQRAGTIFHPVGTARMGPAGDAGAVVDAQLRVQGLAGLYVIDASVMPCIVSGNTASPTIMIAEKGAAMLLA